jgi:hypothetical protein
MRLCANFINVPSNQSWNGEAEALVHGKRRLASAKGVDEEPGKRGYLGHFIF